MSAQTTPETVRRILDPRTPRAEVEQLLQSLSESEKADLILRLAETAHRKTLIVDIANRVSDSLSLDVLFPRLMEVVTETLNADRSSLFLHDPETGELFSRVMQGTVMGEVRFPATLGIAGSVFASGTGEIITDAYADPRFNRDMDRRTGYRTRNILCVPIRNRKHEVIGITQALNKRDGDFDTEDQPAARGAVASGGGGARERPGIRESGARAARGGAAARSREFHRLRDLPRAAAAEDHRRGDPATGGRPRFAVSVRPGDRRSVFPGRRRRDDQGNPLPRQRRDRRRMLHLRRADQHTGRLRRPAIQSGSRQAHRVQDQQHAVHAHHHPARQSCRRHADPQQEGRVLCSRRRKTAALRSARRLRYR